MKTNFLFFYILFFLIAGKLASQNFLGIVNSNYSGTSGVMLNPSSFSNSKLDADINIFTFGGHLQTDYGFIDKSVYNPLNPFKNGFADFKSYQMYSANRPGYLNGTVRLFLPSFMKTIGKYSFGYFCDYRFESNTTQVPINVIRNLYEGNNLPQDMLKNMHTDKFNFALMAWGELGGTFSMKVIDDNEKIVTAGINLKLLESNFGAFVSTQQMDYHFTNTTDMVIDNLDAKFGMSDISKIVSGYGVGTDLGFSYFKKNNTTAFNSNQPSNFVDYKYKIGISIVDIGAIGFKNSLMYAVNTYTDNSVIANNTINSDGLADFNTGNINPDSKLKIVLPTSLSFQYDYNVHDKIYVSSVFTQTLKVFDNQLRRPSLIAISPRYESRKFEVSIPLSVYDYKIPRIGISLRYRGITVGTEKVGWIFKFSNYTGMDGYISLHYFFVHGKKSNPEPDQKSTANLQRTNNSPKYAIGQSYGGGIIFYIDSTGKHGLIAAKNDQSAGTEWGCEGTSIDEAMGTALSAGNKNTNAIITNCITANTAANVCANLVLNGFSDWFLPSKSQLSQMYKNRAAIDSFTENNYWSSSQYNDSSTLAWSQDFSLGYKGYSKKSSKYNVRAVRAF